MMQKDDRLIENIRQQLDQSLGSLDESTLSKLKQARYQAVERQQRKRSHWFFYWGSVPAAGLLLLAMVLNWPMVTHPDPELGFDQLSILTATEPLEFYQEEIEFYEWLSDVLETEGDLSERPAPQSDPAVAEGFSGRGDRCAGTAELGNARLSRLI